MVRKKPAYYAEERDMPVVRNGYCQLWFMRYYGS